MKEYHVTYTEHDEVDKCGMYHLVTLNSGIWEGVKSFHCPWLALKAAHSVCKAGTIKLSPEAALAIAELAEESID